MPDAPKNQDLALMLMVPARLSSELVEGSLDRDELVNKIRDFLEDFSEERTYISREIQRLNRVQAEFLGLS